MSSKPHRIPGRSVFLGFHCAPELARLLDEYQTAHEVSRSSALRKLLRLGLETAKRHAQIVEQEETK